MFRIFLNSISNALVKVFHPVFLFSWFFIFYLNSIKQEADIYTYFKVLGVTSVLPVAFAIIVLKDLHLIQHRKRLWAILFTGFCGIIVLLDGYFNETILLDNLFIVTCLISMILCQLMLFLLTFLDYKASLHAAGVGGILPYLIIIFISLSVDRNITIAQVSISIIAGFLIIRQRFISKSHTLPELIAGFMVGFLTSGMLLYFLYNLTKNGIGS